MIVHELAVLQGRLLSPGDQNSISHPVTTWRHEFKLARQAGLDRIEWVVSESQWKENPLMTVEGREEIAELARLSGVGVGSAYAQVFSSFPLHSAASGELKVRWQALEDLIDAAGKSGLEHIDIPFLGRSAITSPEALMEAADILRTAAPSAQKNGLLLCVKASLKSQELKALLDRIDHKAVRACIDWDSSDSSSPALSDLGPFLACVHLSGDDNSGRLIAALGQVGYQGHFVINRGSIAGLSAVRRELEKLQKVQQIPT